MAGIFGSSSHSLNAPRSVGAKPPKNYFVPDPLDAVVFYSMATSGAEDVPRTLEFLFSRNRLNVAVSRAMCLAVVVASPRLLESRARTIEQMRLINALCRFVDLAEAHGR